MIVTIFNEYHPNERCGKAAKVYPEGIHTAIKELLSDKFEVYTATQDEAYNGLTDELLDKTDVLIWWSKNWDNEILNSVADKVVSRIQHGMGAIFLHSGKNSKPFLRLMGTSCKTKEVAWGENGEREKLYVVSPTHPIAEGIPNGYLIPGEEPYCEYFDVPKPDETVFLGGFENGACVRAGMTFTRGTGKIFYFQPGHDTFPTYRDPVIGKILINAVVWAAPAAVAEDYRHEEKPVKLRQKVKNLFKL